MRVYRISSQAKINLNLNVIKKSQSKGIHLIETLVCFIKLSDKISINKINSNSHKILFTGKYSQGISKKNTIKKLLNLLDKEKKLKNNKYRIVIKKEIPQQSGMGGGSMNAASLLSFFYKKNLLKLGDIKKYAIKTGSDVILGLNNIPKIQYTNGFIRELGGVKKYIVLIVKPSFGCSTKKIYLNNETFSRSEFKNTKGNILKNVILYGKNDLEKSAFKLYPALKKIKELLLKNKQAKFVRMTGSGSALVAYYQSKEKCENAKKKFNKKYKNYWCIASKTI